MAHPLRWDPELASYSLSNSWPSLSLRFFSISRRDMVWVQAFLCCATTICESIIWKAFSFTNVKTGRGPENEGAVVALFHLLFPGTIGAVLFARPSGATVSPNIMNLVGRAVVFVTVIYSKDSASRSPLRATASVDDAARIPSSSFTPPICPSYSRLRPPRTSSSCRILVSQMLASRFLNNFLVRILGVWEPLEDSPQLVATRGIAYYMDAPRTLGAALSDPIHTLVYVTFIISLCALFSKTRFEVSGSSPHDVAKQLKDQQMGTAGHREGSMYKELRRIIPTAVVRFLVSLYRCRTHGRAG